MTRGFKGLSPGLPSFQMSDHHMSDSTEEKSVQRGPRSDGSGCREVVRGLWLAVLIMLVSSLLALGAVARYLALLRTFDGK